MSSKRLPRYKRVENYPEIFIGRPKQAILEAVATYTYLSAPQLTRLLFAPTSLTYVRDHLKDLYQAKYLERVYLPAITPLGSSLAIYTLDTKGVKFLRSLRYSFKRFRRSENVEKSWQFLKHTLQANDLLILAYQLARADEAVSIVNMATEGELKRAPMYVSVKSQRGARRKLGVIPDGWVYLTRTWPNRHEPKRYGVSFELDRNTIEQARFREKLHALATWVETNGYEILGAPSISVCFVAPTQARVEELLRWTEAELIEIGAEDLGEFFLFSSFDTTNAEPTDVFLGPVWLQPFGTSGVSLLENAT